MMTLLHSSLLLIAFVMFWNFCTLFAQTPSSSSQNSIVIGVSMGAATPSGVSSVRSMRMAAEEINAAGGINGRPLVLKVEYGMSKDSLSMDKTITQLIADGAQMIISGSGSSNTLRAARIAVSRGILLMTAASSSPLISDVPDNNLVWRTIPSDVFQANTAAKILRKKKHTRVGIIAINNAYGSALAQAFTRSFQQAGGKVVASVSYPDIVSYDSFDFQRYLDSLYVQKPSAIYLVSYNDDGAKIMSDSKRYFSAKYKPFLFGCDGNYNNDFLLAVEPELLEGMEGLSYVHPMKYTNYEKFFAKFKKYSNQSADTSDLANISLAGILDVEATNSYAATSYDAIYTYALAALKASSDAPAAIAKEIPNISRQTKGAVIVNVGEFGKAREAIQQGKAVNYEGASGPVEFDAKGDVTHGNYVIWRITQGKFVEIGTVSFP